MSRSCIGSTRRARQEDPKCHYSSAGKLHWNSSCGRSYLSARLLYAIHGGRAGIWNKHRVNNRVNPSVFVSTGIYFAVIASFPVYKSGRVLIKFYFELILSFSLNLWVHIFELYALFGEMRPKISLPDFVGSKTIPMTNER